jgi:hypothetical protein
MAQARKYIADTMGDKYADGVILDLEKMWYESTARSPMVCLLSLGSDPTNNIESLAKKHKLGNFFHFTWCHIFLTSCKSYTKRYYLSI